MSGALFALFAALGERALPGFGAGIILLALALAALMQIDRRVLRRGNR